MFYVYHGFVNADNYDASESPVYELTVCIDKQEVLDLKNEFDEMFEVSDGSNPIFKVIKGEEINLIKKKVITEWDFE